MDDPHAVGQWALVPALLDQRLICAVLVCARQAQLRGVDEAIRIDSGAVLEASSSNVFWLAGPELFTPAATLPLYAGTVRQRVIECSPEVGLVVREGAFTPDAVVTAEAVLLVNAARGVECAREVDGRDLGSVPGVIARLCEAVSQRRREARADA